MLTRRIVPCLDVKGGRVVKGVRFEELRDAGDPVEQARAYGRAGADELCFLDISASLESRGTLAALVERVARELSIPFAVGDSYQGMHFRRATTGRNACAPEWLRRQQRLKAVSVLMALRHR